LYKWLSPRFIRECEDSWKFLFGYPHARQEVAKLWDSGYFDGWGVFIPLDQVERSFDGSYRDAMQTLYRTTFQLTDEVLSLIPKGGKVLDVGTGDGNRVRELRAKGYDALGTEINESWIDNDVTIFGEAEALPFDDESFDAVMCIDVLEHLKNPLQAIRELLRISRGSVILQITTVEDRTFMEDPSHLVAWPAERWKRELAEFANVEVRPHFGFVLRKEVKVG